MSNNPLRDMRLGQLLGWRFFIGSARGTLISFISAVALLGMSLAIALLILVLSVMNGFETEFRQRILGLAPHASLSFQPPLSHWREAQRQLQQHPAVSDAQPVIEINAVALRQGRAQPLQLQGVDYLALQPRFAAYIEDSGKSLQRGEIIIGAQLAEKLALQRGQNLRLLLPDHDITENGREQTKIHSLRVREILRSNTELDNYLGLISLAEAAAITGTEAVETLQIQVRDVFSAAHTASQIAEQLAQQYPHSIWISDWSQRYGNLYSAIQLSRQLVGLLLASVIAVAAFNILVTLGMMVRHKRADIAILRTIGLSRSAILQAFVVQGMTISLLGCLLGSLLGILLANAAPALAEQLQQWIGVELLQTDIYPINYLPSQLRGEDIVLICSTALLITLLATLYPAWRAAQIAPANALQQG